MTVHLRETGCRAQPYRFAYSALTLLTVLLFLVFALDIVLHPYQIHHDCAGILQAAQMMVLEGKRLYVDIESVNPPLIYYLNTIPVIVADRFALSVIPVFSLMVFAAFIWSSIMLWRALRALAQGEKPVWVELIVLVWALINLGVWLIGEFGQREHLFIVLYCPFFIWRAMRWEGLSIKMPTAVSIGMLAAVGVCLKPHFVLIAMSVELYWLLVKRKPSLLFTSEFIAFVIVGVAYALAFLFFMPADMHEALFELTLPFVAKGYSAYNEHMAIILYANAIGLTLGIALITFTFLSKHYSDPRYRRIYHAVGVMTVLAFAIYLLQHKGWTYQAIPYYAGIVFMLAGFIGRMAGSAVFVRLDARHGGAVAAAKIACIVLGILGIGVWGSTLLLKGIEPMPQNGYAQVIADHSHAGDKVEFIATTQVPGYPLMLQMNRMRASRYGNHFPVPFLVVIRDKYPELAAKEQKRYLKNLAFDLHASEPQLIFIANESWYRWPEVLPEGFSFESYLDSVGFIKNELQNYKFLMEIDGFSVYKKSDASRAGEKQSPG